MSSLLLIVRAKGRSLFTRNGPARGGAGSGGFFCAMQVVAFHFAPYGIWRGGRVKFEQFVHMRDV